MNATVREVIHQQRADTARRRNKLPPIGKLDRKTIVCIRKRLGAKRRHAQNMNDVRVSAASDARNAFTLYVMLLAYTKFLWDCMVFNWDATTFEIKKEGDKYVWIINDKDDNSAVTASGNSESPIGVKWIPFISADGVISRVVLMFSVERSI